MHFRPDWATRMHLPWAHSDPVKLRALCFWAPVAVAAFTRGQCYSMRKVPDLLCKPSTTCPDTTMLWFGVLILTVPLDVHWAQKAASGTHFGLNFEHPSRDLCWTRMSLIFFYLLQFSQILERDLSVLVVCSSVTFRRQPCCWAFCSAENWGKKHRARSLSCKSNTTRWSALLNAKGQSIPSLFFYPVSLTINVIALINIHSKRSFAQTN